MEQHESHDFPTSTKRNRVARCWVVIPSPTHAGFRDCKVIESPTVGSCCFWRRRPVSNFTRDVNLPGTPDVLREAQGWETWT